MLDHKASYIKENNRKIGYADAVLEAESIAERARGKKCCAIACTSEMSTALALLGCFAAGVTAVPLSIRYGSMHCKRIVDTVSPDCVIRERNGRISVHSLSDSEYIPPEKHPTLIMCTSGTTGSPKGAMLDDECIITNVRDVSGYFGMSDTDTILIARPLYHCAVLTGEFLTALTVGANVVFCSEPFNPVRLSALVKKCGATVFCGTPTLMSALAKIAPKERFESVKRAAVSGECLDRKTAESIRALFKNASIYSVYGLTEASPRVSFLPPELFETYPDCVGIPLPSVRVKITDNNGVECPVGVIGRLWVKGKNVMKGYYNAKEATARVLKNGWLDTGDLAEINDAGLIKIHGRADDMLIISGMNVYPQEVEAAMKADPRVREVLVYGVKDKNGVEHLAMSLAGDFKDKSEALHAAAALLPSYEVPNIIELVGELPKNGSGKLIRKR